MPALLTPTALAPTRELKGSKGAPPVEEEPFDPSKFKPVSPETSFDPSGFKPAGAPAPIFQDKASLAVGGAIQGAVLDPIEGIGQIVEHYTGKRIPIPQSVRDYFSRVQQEVHASGLGRGAELTGAIGSMFIAPEAAIGWLGRGAKAVEAARAARELGAAREAATVTESGARGMNLGEMAQASKGAREVRQASKASEAIPRLKAAEEAAGRPLTEAERAEVTVGGKGPGPPPPPPRTPGFAAKAARGAAGGAATAVAQPVQGDQNFTQQKAAQAAAGGLLGGAAGGLANVPLARMVHALRRHPLHAAGSAAFPAYALHALGLGHYAAPVGLAALVAALLGKAGPGAIEGAGGGVGQMLEGSPDASGR